MEKYCSARQDIGDSTIRHMRCACWITKAADTHSECVILIAFPQQCASVLLYSCITCLVDHFQCSKWLWVSLFCTYWRPNGDHCVRFCCAKYSIAGDHVPAISRMECDCLLHVCQGTQFAMGPFSQLHFFHISSSKLMFK